MASEPADIVLDLVGEKLRRLTATPSDQFNIFKVPDVLRKLNEKAYEPEMLAIGPYHHGQEQLLAFEEHKTRYLKKLLERTRIPLSDYVMAMRALEERARKCYGGSTSLNRDEFVQMMLLDGCFIVEVIRKFRLKHLRGDDDPNFKLGWMLPSIARDMILLENQLPFFVIWKLFIMTDMPSDSRNESFLVMILRFFNGILPGKGCRRDIVYQVDVYPINEIKHLVHLIHENWLPSPAGVEAYRNNATNNSYWSFIGSATEIQEAGIHFRKVGVLKDDSLFDIKFENGVMKMPSLEIGDATETILQNFIAYEQCSQDLNLKHVIDYVEFLNCLINSSKDAELLRRRGIIENLLGDDEVIATLLNKLCDGVVLGERFYYREVFNKVILHCSRRRNKWMAKLRHNYFNTPWAIISVLAALFLLLLTLQQALFAVLSYYQQAQSH
ncbi:DUF862 domain-containing protein [Citrus sinensis]|uniref:UPF0481 protein At3g47200-like n=1 Tax=Citrus sinensis TaxID=2711 RepID=UPI00219FB09E|nr:UPF0481 protein At3g47200-like [Citrus sinensis]KAH9650190.1 DUF862 domain-containing protein [Citrus sinensis]